MYRGRRQIGFALALALALAAVLTPLDWIGADERPVASPAETRLRADVAYLASDLREGRGAGTKGLEDAAEYIAAVFREAGLKPAPGADGYFQRFSIRGELRSVAPTRLSVRGPGESRVRGELGVDFQPLQRGGGGKIEGAPLVFAGYGIAAHDEELKLDYDDYEGLDVKGKVVLILRQEPDPKDPAHPFAGRANTSYATYRSKARTAAEKGAAAVLLANNQANLTNGKDVLLETSQSDGNGTGIPFVMVTRAFADRLLELADAPRLSALEERINADAKPHSLALEGVTIDAEVALESTPFHVRNVVGVLEGSGPTADETIVIGAHYDHVGYGGLGSLAPGVREIHNGADDNASGTALILELARRMARRPDPLPRRLVFIAFAGEERGLLGSRHYVENPLFPLEQTVAMFNFDMVGRLNPARELTVFGAPTIEGLDALAVALAKSQGITANIVADTSMQFNASDHASFYRKNIPVFFPFTGTHSDYHRPGDDTEKINFEGMARIANLSELLLLDLARRPERPDFKRLPGSPRILAGRSSQGQGGTGQGQGGGGGAYFGSQPAYGVEVKGVKLDGVTEGSPADKAGLKAGDIIVKFGGQPVEDLESYMDALSRRKPGDMVEVVVLREGKETTLKATLGTRASPTN